MIDEAPTINRPRLVREPVYLPPIYREVTYYDRKYPPAIRCLIYLGAFVFNAAFWISLAVFLTSVGHG